jgi:hypothetical protein
LGGAQMIINPQHNSLSHEGEKNVGQSLYTLKQNEIGHLKIKNNKVRRVENFKCLEIYLMKITITQHTYKKE